MRVSPKDCRLERCFGVLRAIRPRPLAFSIPDTVRPCGFHLRPEVALEHVGASAVDLQSRSRNGPLIRGIGAHEFYLAASALWKESRA